MRKEKGQNNPRLVKKKLNIPIARIQINPTYSHAHQCCVVLDWISIAVVIAVSNNINFNTFYYRFS